MNRGALRFVLKKRFPAQWMFGKEVVLAARPACKKVKVRLLKQFKDLVLVEE